MNLYDVPVLTADGRSTTLAPYRGQVLLIVNVASQCGFTPQYEGLEELHGRYRTKGLAVLGFPCDQFGHQEPGSDEEIQEFCRLNYGVSFPVFAKIEVNGPGEHPLYHLLKREQPGMLGTTAIKWNFTKFLVSRSGAVLERYASTSTPAQLEPDIRRALGEKPARAATRA